MTDEVKNTVETPAEETNPLRSFLHHQRRAAEEGAKALAALVPPDFRSHSRQAKEEWLMSFKVLVDGVSAAVDREIHKMSTSKSADSSDSGTTTGKTKVKVEVS